MTGNCSISHQMSWMAFQHVILCLSKFKLISLSNNICWSGTQQQLQFHVKPPAVKCTCMHGKWNNASKQWCPEQDENWLPRPIVCPTPHANLNWFPWAPHLWTQNMGTIIFYSTLFLLHSSWMGNKWLKFCPTSGTTCTKWTMHSGKSRIYFYMGGGGSLLNLPEHTSCCRKCWATTEQAIGSN